MNDCERSLGLAGFMYRLNLMVVWAAAIVAPILLLLALRGEPQAFANTIALFTNALPAGILAGVVLSAIDWYRLPRRYRQYAQLEKSRRELNASRWSLRALRQDSAVRQRVDKQLRFETVIFLLSAAVFVVTTGGFIGGIGMAAIAYTTEWACWRLILRDKFAEGSPIPAGERDT